jgi:outer membrane receptor protein involved in Fe transport
MKNSIGILILIFSISLITTKIYGVSFSGKCEIVGVVKDSISGEGLPFASVQVLTINDSSFVEGKMTDAKGKYLISDVQSGEYIIMASYMGYTRSEKRMNFRSKKVKCDFSLVHKNITLSEVSISAEKNQVEKNIDITTVNVSKNITVSGGTATDVMLTLPSVDIDFDGNINYRGSQNVIILINGEESGLATSLDQIPADQIERVELINNPSAKYEAEGMSGIINIVLKSGEPGKNKTTLIVYTGYPETIGGNVGYSKMTGKTRFFINGGMKHSTKFQTKEHLRENYENPDAYNYYQYDRQDQNLNSAFFSSDFEYIISKKQQIGVSLIGSKMFNNAVRKINYSTLSQSGNTEIESLKELDINLDSYSIDGSLDYMYSFTKGGVLSSKIHYSFFNQLQEMDNKYYFDLSIVDPELQNTFSKQINKQTDFSLDYKKPFNDSLQIETGYYLEAKDLLNDFNAESFNTSGEWVNDTALENKFNYSQVIHAVYFSLNAKFKYFELQTGLRGEITTNLQDNSHSDEYFDIFPSLKLTRKVNKYTSVYASYSRRINRPTIKMLNPFSDEYADLLNMHIGNPDLKPEYVNSVEIGSRIVFDKFSCLGSIYYRNINHAISRIKSATNDSALIVSFINLDRAKLIGGEISFTYKPFSWWNINSSSNIFYTNLSGIYENNQINNGRMGWTSNLSNNFKIPFGYVFQISGYYRSKLPSVMGIYEERYYIDLALSKKILNNRAQLIFKISDVFNTYKYGLDLDGTDVNGFRYSQINRRKNESQYFILSFVYNIDGKNQKKKKQKENFFLNTFDK